MSDELIFIGEKANQAEMAITCKPDFYDALLLSKQSSQNPHYQSIPLRMNKFIFIHFPDANIHFTYRKHALTLEGEKQITEEEAFHFFKHFAIKEGRKITYLAHCPSNPQQRKKLLVMKEGIPKPFDDL
ncbi:MAG TPA: hypothetical protein VGI04_06505 [Neobacillus sp.]|jgi:hypothetical protein